MSGSVKPESNKSEYKAKYQRSNAFILLNSAIRCRYDRTQVKTQSIAVDSLNPLSRHATTKLAARRLTSHSQGAGKVSSRSLMEKITCLSGVAKPPKLQRWASPQHCTRIPVTAV